LPMYSGYSLKYGSGIFVWEPRNWKSFDVSQVTGYELDGLG